MTKIELTQNLVQGTFLYADCRMFFMFSFDSSPQQTDLDGEVQAQPVSPSAAGAVVATTAAPTPTGSGPKRLHVSNIPFRFREADLRNLLGVRLWNLYMVH